MHACWSVYPSHPTVYRVHVCRTVTPLTLTPNPNPNPILQLAQAVMCGKKVTYHQVIRPEGSREFLYNMQPGSYAQTVASLVTYVHAYPPNPSIPVQPLSSGA